ncbi:hypothetical protein ACROYT_G015016 [Oculina patagonica]
MFDESGNLDRIIRTGFLRDDDDEKELRVWLEWGLYDDDDDAAADDDDESRNNNDEEFNDTEGGSNHVEDSRQIDCDDESEDKEETIVAIVQTQLAHVQTKILGKHSQVAKSFKEWEKLLTMANDCLEPTLDDIEKDEKGFHLYKTLRLSENLVQKIMNQMAIINKRAKQVNEQLYQAEGEPEGMSKEKPRRKKQLSKASIIPGIPEGETSDTLEEQIKKLQEICGKGSTDLKMLHTLMDTTFPLRRRDILNLA